MNEEKNINNKKSLKEILIKNKNKLILILISLVILIFILIFLNENKERKILELSQSFNTAKIFLENKNKNEAKKILVSIIEENDNFYSPSALNLIVENDLIDSQDQMLELFDNILNSKKIDKETRNLFILKKTLFLGDGISENELLQNLNPLIQSNSIWKTNASEYIKKYYISKNQIQKAKEFELIKNQN